MATSYPCGTSGSFTVTSGEVSGHSACTGALVVPNGVTAIGDRAFFGGNQITSVVIPESVISIGDSAFFGANKITHVQIGNGVTTIGDSAFFGANKITQVTFGSGLTSIESEAFFGNTLLSSLTFGGDAPTLGQDSFLGVNATANVLSGKQGFGTSVWNGFPIVFITFNVSFDSQGGSVVQPVNASSISVSPDTERTGYSLIGWFDQAAGGTQIDFPCNVGSNVSLFAQWQQSFPPASLDELPPPVYFGGPQIQGSTLPHFTQGEEGTVTLTGKRMSGILSATINGVAVTVTADRRSATITVPATLAAGTYDLVLQTTNGRVTVMRFIKVS